ncbi:MAG: DNA-3-methyladenine glycosylase 2 family protein [Actinomycetota bacterium]|nr:DNA-3-methyladenine glycosylase 2 family protein [Actinomycetota bacterium]
MLPGDAALDWVAPYGVDLDLVLGPFLRGGHDPSALRERSGRHWRTLRTPDGPATLALAADDQGQSGSASTVRARAWGPGAGWAIGSVPGLLGAGDDPTGFPAHLLPAHLQPQWRALAGRWRVPRSGLVLEALVPAVLEQKVTGIASRRSWTALLKEVGDPAPGPTPRPMRVFPDPERIRAVASWQWHRWGTEPFASATVVRAAQHAGRLDACAGRPLPDARRRLAAVDGVGRWTVAETCARALGDADAVSFGDYHLAAGLAYAFTGRRDGTDEDMADLLEPFAGHRYRVQRLVETSGIERPRRGPRMSVPDNRSR